MKFFPNENFYIISDLNPLEAQKRIQSSIYIPDIGIHMSEVIKNYDYSTKYFKGFAINNSFKLEPDIAYRNSFIPQIKGTIENHKNGSIITVKMTLMSFAIIFMIFASAFVLIAGISLTITGIEKNNIKFQTFIPYIMLLFIYGLATFSFKYESRKSKDILIYILEGEIRE